MVWSLLHVKRRRRIAKDAALSRASRYRRIFALAAVIAYNLVGLADIYSTVAALDAGAGVEANPFIRMMMEHAGDSWVLGKLLLQGVITFMVLWFPHWFVLGVFSIATAGNAWVVYNNLAIAGFF